MKKIRNAFLYVKGRYQLLLAKKYTTIAGTLVFFLIMSIMPFAFWLTLCIGRLPIDTQKIFDLPVFSSIKKVLQYVEREAKQATAGASVVLLATTLYSSSNLFYQMRRIGEIVYDVRRKHRGIKTRFIALGVLGCVLVLIVAFLLVYAIGSRVLSLWGALWVERLVGCVLLGVVAFLLALLLNAYVCPYRKKWGYFLTGVCITILWWAVAAFGFSLYLKIGNAGRLYGALSAVIVFLLWLYVMTIGFVVGVIFNSEKIAKG